MKVVIQRVKSASVSVDSELISSIGKGLLVFAGIGQEDTEKDAENLVNKWKRNVQDIEGEVLCVSQFTLYAKMKKGNKPDFHDAAKPETARRVYDYFYDKMRESYIPDRVKNGVFQAMMEVELKNDGPVTIEINTNLPKKEPKEPKDNNKPEEEEEIKKTFEFQIPAELLE
ncbi:hypothetical protein N7508_005139 [Penicillium antarcticum]|uniref:uncharacterized protein n=1 Tax=Penicillium antarcticum TaxID=416450 RepID=UPI00238E1E3C|nr:uncharacterized protein N7508_005139 [Penicillium antarcticum]KAJ5306124.1 hypothetical protein N7508_005139 [Penicillium antarcticum]